MIFKDKFVLSNAKKYAYKCHKNVNQRYDNKPYSIHLDMVYNYAIKYLTIIIASGKYSHEYIINVLAACYCHDIIEDARETYNDVLKRTNKDIAELVYALTNEKGKNRAQRACDKYYDDMKQVPLADFIKICDRLANTKYSTTKGSRMSSAYAKEYKHFKEKLYKDEYKPMFDELEELLFSEHTQSNSKFFIRFMNASIKILDFLSKLRHEKK